jgi:hypothetical protein
MSTGTDDAAVYPLCLSALSVSECGPAFFCQRTWPEVLTATTCQGRNAGIVQDRRRDCGPYHVRTIVLDYWPAPEIAYQHTTETMYYDIATGDLVAMFEGWFTADKLCANTPTMGIQADCLPGATPDASTAGTDLCAIDGGSSRG